MIGRGIVSPLVLQHSPLQFPAQVGRLETEDGALEMNVTRNRAKQD